MTFNDLADSPNVAISAANTLPNWQSPDFGMSPDQAGLNTLMTNIRYGNTVSAVLSGLVPGDTYKLQLLTYDPNIPNEGGNRRFDIYQDGMLLAHNYATAGAGDVGTVFIDEFTATSAQTTILLTGATISTGLGYDPTPVLQGLTLADTTGATAAAGPVGVVSVSASSAGSLVLSGSLNLHDSGVVVSAAGPVMLSGNVVGSGTGSSVTKTGTAPLTLGGANTYAGVTNIVAGNVIVASSTALGAASAGTNVAAGSSLLFAAGINYAAAEPVTVEGTGGGGTIANLGGASTFAGSIQVVTPVVTVGTFTGGDVGEGLDLDGNIVDAEMANDAPGVSPTVIRDAAFVTAGQDPNVSLNGLATIPNWIAPTYGANPTDANNLGLDVVMNTIQHGQYQPGIISIDLHNLVPGTSYKLQLLFQEGGGSARRFNVYFNGTPLATQFASSSNSGNKGVVVTYDFVAAAADAVVSLDGAGAVSNDLNPILNAFTLEKSPSDYTQSAGVLNLAGGTGSLTLSGSMSLANSAAKFSGNVTVSGAIGGTGTGAAVVQTGTGTTTLTGNNTYAGSTLIPSGTIIAGSFNALGATSGATTITGGTLAFAGGITVGPEPVVVVPTATPTVDAVVNLSGNNTFTGTLGQPLPIASVGSVDIGSAAGTLTITGNVTFDGQKLVVDGAGSTKITGNVTGATVVQNSFSQAVLATPGLTSYWRLDDAPGSTTAADSSGNGNNLTYVNPTAGEFGQPGALAGDADTAITLDGTDQYATIPSTVFQFPGGGDQTFETWFKTTSSGVLLSVTGAGSVPGSAGQPSGWVPALYVGTDGKVYASMFWHGSTGAQVVSPGAYNDGTWHHVADVYSGGTETLYIDGNLIGTMTGDSQVDFNGGAYSYYLGTGFANGWAASNQSWFYFNGSLDDTAVYSTPLSPATIAAHAAFATMGPINASMSLTKKGSGTLTLAGTNSYAGITSVSAGSLLVNGSIDAASPISVSSGATLGGSGTVGTVSGPGVYSPGAATPGTLTTAGVSLGAGTLVIDLASGTSFDQLKDATDGTTVDITGTTLSLNVGAVNTPETFTILSVPGTLASSLIGTFVNLPMDGSTFVIGGEKFTVNYSGGDGNDVVLSAQGAAPPTLVSTVRNGGIAYVNSTLATTQHSMVEDIVYSFSSAVSLSVSNFTISGLPGSGTTVLPTLGLSGNGTSTVWTVTFSGAGVNPATNSIGDGEYRLVLSGVAGLTDSTYDFFRLLGDMDGTGLVNIADFNTVVGTFLRATNDPAYLGAADLDGDGSVGIADINLLIGNFLHSVPAPLPN